MANKSAISNYIFHKLSESIEGIMEETITESINEESNKQAINEKIMAAVNDIKSQDTDKLLQSAKIPITYSFWTTQLEQYVDYKAFETAVKEEKDKMKGGKRKSHKKRKHVKNRKTNKQKGGDDEIIGSLTQLQAATENAIQKKAQDNIDLEDKERVRRFVVQFRNFIGKFPNSTKIIETDVTLNIFKACIYIYSYAKSYDTTYDNLKTFLKTVFEKWKGKYYKRLQYEGKDVTVLSAAHNEKIKGLINDETSKRKYCVEKSEIDYATKNGKEIYEFVNEDNYNFIENFGVEQQKNPDYDKDDNKKSRFKYTYNINEKEVDKDIYIYEKVEGVPQPDDYNYNNVIEPSIKNENYLSMVGYNTILKKSELMNALKQFYGHNIHRINHLVVKENETYTRQRLENETERLKKIEQDKQDEEKRKAEILKRNADREDRIQKLKDLYNENNESEKTSQITPANTKINQVMNFMNPSNESLIAKIIKSIEDSVVDAVMNNIRIIDDNITEAFKGGKFEKMLKRSIEAYIQEKVFENFNRNNQVGERMRTELTNLSEFITTQKLLLLVEGENKKRIKKYLDEKEKNPVSS